MKRYEVVCSKSYFDVGLYKGENEIRSRASTYNPNGKYGNGCTTWIKTGVFLLEDEWNKITYNKPTDQILNELHIRKENYKNKIMAKKEINGIEVNGESIITALKIIKQVCDDNDGKCGICPFGVDVSDDEWVCGITDTEPDNWNILEYKKFQALG